MIIDARIDIEITPDIEVCYSDTLIPIKNVFYADFENNFVIRYTFDEIGNIQKDGWGIIPHLYRAEIIPVYKGN